MKITDAIKAIATLSTVASKSIRRDAWPAGEYVRHATTAEGATTHVYVKVAGETVLSFDASSEDLEADDWAVLGANGAAVPTPKAPPADKGAPTAPQTPNAKR